jgi:DNA-binding transcriptional LysR family regulator
MNINLRQLRTFLAVARLGHFRRAAETVHLTQPAVSRQIAELETELGVRLFDRTTREVLVTEAGRYLESALARVLDELESVLGQVQTEGERRRGKVRVASVPTLSASLMPAAIASCQQRFPGLAILLGDQPQSQVLDAVRGGEVDFGVAIEPPGGEEFDVQTIMHDAFALVCPRDHALAAKRRVDWRALAAVPLVLLDHGSGSRRLIDAAFADRGIAPNIVQQVGHPQTAFSLVAAGLGVCVTPGLSLSMPLSASLVSRPLAPTVRRDVVMIRRRNRSLSPPAQAAWQVIADIATQWQHADHAD